MTIAVIYPGTFDPITHGHTNLIERAAKIFSSVVVAVAADTAKQTLFSIDERVDLAKQTLKHLPHVEICGFKGLLVEFAKQKNITTILRGVRAIADFEYERQLAGMNEKLMTGIDTIFLAPNERYTHISSTFVRDIARLKGDVSPFVAPMVVEAFKKLF